MRRQYGRQSEKINPEDSLPGLQDLFMPSPAETHSEPAKTETVTFERKVKGHGRDELPAHLRRVQTVVTADKSSVDPIEKGLAGAGLLAQVMVSK